MKSERDQTEKKKNAEVFESEGGIVARFTNEELRRANQLTLKKYLKIRIKMVMKRWRMIHQTICFHAHAHISG